MKLLRVIFTCIILNVKYRGSVKNYLYATFEEITSYYKIKASTQVLKNIINILNFIQNII